MAVRRPAYSSAIAGAIEGYLDMKASVGLECLTRNYVLYDLDKWMAANGATGLDEASVVAWAEDRHARQPNAGVGSWAAVEREFAYYIRAMLGGDAYSLPKGWGGKPVRMPPYLISEDEAEAFFDEALRLKWQGSMAWQSACMFGLMYACGLRPGEVRRLRRDHIRRDSAEIDIVESKGCRSRRLPVTDEVMSLVSGCDDRTSRTFGADRDYLFCNAVGDQVSAGTLSRAFLRIWRQADLPESRHGRKPTCYLLRHHFAYANIERWARNGVDVNAMLPYLSRYMGHANIEKTMYYVHTSPDFLSGFSAIGTKLDSILPEVGFHG